MKFYAAAILITAVIISQAAQRPGPTKAHTMTESQFIAIPATDFNQLNQAAQIVNDRQKAPGVTFTGWVSLAEISRIPAAGQDPERIRVMIQYSNRSAFFELAKIFGIILEKVKPHNL